MTTTTGLHTSPLVLLSLSQTFGGAPGPPGFSDISNLVTDLANLLARTPPAMLARVQKSPYFDQLTQIQDTRLPTDQLAQALPLRVHP